MCVWGGGRGAAVKQRSNTLKNFFYVTRYIYIILISNRVFTLILKSFFVLFPRDVILKFRDKIEKMEKDVYAVLQLEAEEKEMQQSEAQVRP